MHGFEKLKMPLKLAKLLFRPENKNPFERKRFEKSRTAPKTPNPVTSNRPCLVKLTTTKWTFQVI